MEDLFPVLPFRAELYTPAELFAGFSLVDPDSYARTTDFRAYRSTLLDPNRDVGMLRALHDQSVSDHRDELLEGRRVVAIMGGHAMSRRDDAYRQVAEMARSLARSGFLVVSGGGPGATAVTAQAFRKAKIVPTDFQPIYQVSAQTTALAIKSGRL